MEDLSAYREAFIEELVDQLERMEQDLLSMEKDASEEIVQSIFRSAHTIKGSSAAMGFEEMKSLTHEVEHLLDMVRGNKLEVDPRLINLLFGALDVLKALRDEYMRGHTYSDISKLLYDLQNFTKGTEVLLPKWRNLPELTLEQSLRLEEAVESGLRLLKIQLSLADDCPMKAARFHLIAQEISAQYGAIIVSEPSALFKQEGAAAEDGYSESVFLISTSLDIKDVQNQASILTDVRLAKVESYKQPLSKKESQPLPGPKETVLEEKSKQGPQTIRVSVERLEHLMNLVGELLIDQTSLSQLKQSVSHRFANEEFVERLSDITDHMSSIVEELQESVMKARMLPIEHLFNRFPRMVRDLSQKLDKEIELVLEGMETELDRTLIEEIGDPLIHLIRNAVDHGIESAETRLSKGKRARGRVRLNSYHEDNQVVITVEDDGAGIIPERIKASALRKGIISEEEAGRLSDHSAMYLIFQPGFSTAASVSEVSGRGVGMDIVRNQIERLNGLIDIQSTPDVGTCFTVRIPLTLAIITGLMVKVSDRDFVIPMNNVIEIVRVPMEEIQTVQGESVIVIRNQVIPLVWLCDALHYSKGELHSKFIPVVIVGSAEKKLAVAVDELMGNQEIVIKTLGTFLGKIPFIAGATILGNGRVALILEIAYLIQRLKKDKARAVV
ncbi:chemotaxis protein CheA [Paenibacillus radicis (ex Xue et al. 2023)]|uniref:Chemotaxis protein CheA n=1 Tax=Paenibacillus radicis (ex Xue et al. 2023) TaxID=2972489 RepID=A0ABT1YGZ0_9BACL|nr:chemotaxis protein CheA [Paenibacillus radicis (ex Xue et al. 2023)]MCR8632463.1 chemotaxis protein CheA [Paenibacillus radicis (ex Xue et al. 2023)]